MANTLHGVCVCVCMHLHAHSSLADDVYASAIVCGSENDADKF